MKRYSTILQILIIMGLFISCNAFKKKPATTVTNLNVGIAEESTSCIKYAAFANKAEDEGLFSVAILFTALSKSENIQATNHLAALTTMGRKMDSIIPVFEIKSTRDNLESAIEEEEYEATQMYPDFLKTSKKEKAVKATNSFTWALNEEKQHKTLYQKALNALNNHTLSELPIEYYVCPLCGNTFKEGFQDKLCPYCNTKADQFLEVQN